MKTIRCFFGKHDYIAQDLTVCSQKITCKNCKGKWLFSAEDRTWKKWTRTDEAFFGWLLTRTTKDFEIMDNVKKGE